MTQNGSNETADTLLQTWYKLIKPFWTFIPRSVFYLVHKAPKCIEQHQTLSLTGERDRRDKQGIGREGRGRRDAPPVANLLLHASGTPCQRRRR